MNQKISEPTCMEHPPHVLTGYQRDLLAGHLGEA